MRKPRARTVRLIYLIIIIANILAIGVSLLARSATQDNPVGTSMQDYMADPGVQNVYQECSYKGWPIVARLGNLRQESPLPSKSILYLFVKNNTVDIHTEYFRTPQGRYVLMISFPAAVVDKALVDFLKK